MAGTSGGVVDFKVLQKELSTAVEAEAARKRIDEMKKRAITNSASYDEFRHKVACAHLKKLDRKDMESLGRSEPHQRSFTGNTVASKAAMGGGGRKLFKDKTKCDELKFSADAPTAKPKNSADFERDWRRRCPTASAKFRYLLLVEPANLPAIFTVELPDVILDGIVDALAAVTGGSSGGGGGGEGVEDMAAVRAQAGGDGAVASLVLDILAGMSRVNRFDLTTAFMSKKQKAAVNKVIDWALAQQQQQQQQQQQEPSATDGAVGDDAAGSAGGDDAAGGVLAAAVPSIETTAATVRTAWGLA